MGIFNNILFCVYILHEMPVKTRSIYSNAVEILFVSILFVPKL